MNKEVYLHWLCSYGRRPLLWCSLATEGLRTILSRVLIPIILAGAAAALADGNTDVALESIGWFFGAVMLTAVLGPLGNIIGIQAENKAYRLLRMIYYRKLVGKDMCFYRDNQTGYLSTMFRQYLDSMIMLSRLLRTEAVRASISLIAPIIVLLAADWQVGVITAGIVAIQVVYIAWSSAKANKYRAWSHEIYRKTSAEVTDEITNIIAFKSSGHETEGHATVARLGNDETSAFWHRYKITSLLDLPRGVVTGIGITLAFVVMINNAANNPAASVGLMVLLLTYLFQLMRLVDHLPNLITQHDDLITKLHPGLSYLKDDHEDVVDPKIPRKLTITHGAIAFRNISFRYPTNSTRQKYVTVFKNFNLSIQGGEHVGIVGLSGAGKSTLASLLMRFDDVGKGSVEIDGTDIRNVTQSELRRNIAYVPQEPLLFHRSIHENIAYFENKISKRHVIRAAKAAHAHEFISKLPDKYNTIVGERGVKLSGGQKQRVAIARAILKNTPIMLFDEATSALDSESEHIIQGAMPDIIGTHTAIVIAHRLSTVANLDRIIVMHNGKVVEEGSHRALLRRKGRYYKLWQRQVSNK